MFTIQNETGCTPSTLFLKSNPQQGMYKNRVENDRNFFEIPALLSCEPGNPTENRVGKLKKYMLF